MLCALQAKFHLQPLHYGGVLEVDTSKPGQKAGFAAPSAISIRRTFLLMLDVTENT